ncbi:hypothetical protein ACIQAC_34865 [Streptomyces sp. NPDC088387]|uniref:hypothetical protein n=1 Tax=Streptomyces sp. NPDC088387 TaxID=3365859 RepID=UPI00383037F2
MSTFMAAGHWFAADEARSPVCCGDTAKRWSWIVRAVGAGWEGIQLLALEAAS